MGKYKSISVSLTPETHEWIAKQPRNFNFSELVRRLLEPEMRKIQNPNRRVIGENKNAK